MAESRERERQRDPEQHPRSAGIIIKKGQIPRYEELGVNSYIYH